MLDVLLFALGVAAGAFSHEAGHQVGAWVHGEELRWRGRAWACVAPCENRKAVALYGLGAQAVSSELLLLPEKRGPFTSGWLVWNVLQPVSVVVRNEVDRDSTDLQNFGRGDSRLIGGLFLAHSTTVALRWAWKDKPDWFEVSRHEDGIKAVFMLRF